MKQLRKSLVAIVTGVALLTLAACGGGNPEAKPSEGGSAGGETGKEVSSESKTLRIGNIQDVFSFDPADLDTGRQVLYWQAVYETLLVYSPEGEILPGLATEFNYNDDRTVLNLKLRDDITFTDGEKFNAEAVKANIENLQGGTGVSVYQVDMVKEVNVLGDYEVEIVLDGPDPAFTYYLTLVAGAMASPAAIGTEELTAMPVGAGPYTLDASKTIAGSEYTFVRNPDHYDQGAYPYDTIVVKPFEDLTARLNALKSGQVDAIDADPTIIKEAESSQLQILRNPIAWNGLVFYGRTDGKTPALHDVRVRRALSHAIDSETILEQIYQGAGHDSRQIFNRLSPAHDPELESYYPYDPEKARELLAEAGYADGFELTMPEFPGVPLYPILTQQLGEIGVTVKWEKLAAENIVPAMMGGDFDAASFGSSSGHPWRDIEKMISANGAWNPMGSEDPRLTELLEKIPLAEGAAQDELYKEVSRFLVEEAWFGVWFFTDTVFLTNQDTNVVAQSGSTVPYIRNFSPAN